jgi:TonB family protein
MLLAAVLLAQASLPPPTPDPTRYLLINSDRTSRKALYMPVAPAFPAELCASVQATTVLIDAVLDSQGRVTRAAIVKGDVRAHEAALRAAIQWSFEPPDGETADHEVQLSFVFRTLPATVSAEELEVDFSEKYRVEVRARVATPSSEP